MPSSWADQIKTDILDLKMRVTALETQVNSMRDGILGAASKPVVFKDTKSSDFTTGNITSETDLLKQYKDANGNTNFNQMSMDLVAATYSIRTASTAMKGYLMLLNQAGLSEDQNALVRDLEYVNMAIIKVMTTIKLFQLAISATNPYMLLFYLFAAGGTIASSVAYGNKVTGGGV